MPTRNPAGMSSAFSAVPSGHGRADTYGPPDAQVPICMSS